MADYRIVSSDDHIVEPPDLWSSRIESKWGERTPRIFRVEDGDWWYCDGIKIESAKAGTQAGIRFEDQTKLEFGGLYEDVLPGAMIPQERIKDMDSDGIDVSIIYPSIGLVLFGVPDSVLLTDVFSAYNDWLAEYCSHSPKRLKGIAMLDVDDIGSAVKEMERCAKLGFVGAMIAVAPVKDRPYSLPEYEPLWAAAQDLEMPLSLHTATNRPGTRDDVANPKTPVVSTNNDFWVRQSLANMIFTGVFERYPKLKAGAIEFEIAWVPYFVDRMNYDYTQRPIKDEWYRFKTDMIPGDFFHENVFLSFQEDGTGIRLRDIIGVDKLQWGSDYPHREGTFPHSRQILEEILADCTEEEKAKIVGENAVRLYHIS